VISFNKNKGITMFDALALLARQVSDFLWGWPLIIIFLVFGTFATCYLYFAQFRFFFTSWKLVLSPEKGELETTGEITPFQAFINALGTGTGNGSLAGVAVAVYAGGPGAAFWLLVAGFLAMIMRFAEVYVATSITSTGIIKGGPMVYLTKVPGGAYLPTIFAVFMLTFGLATGNAMQANSIALGMFQTWGIAKLFTAVGLLTFMTYVVFGGASRIISVSDKLVPFKVGLFMVSFISVLAYHYATFFSALKLIFLSAWAPAAVGGAVAGIAVQTMIRYGFSRSLSATEAGLGTAAVLFGASRSDNPLRDSIISLLGMFISNVVCFMVALAIVASGVWDNGLTSTALTISAFNTVFGQYGGWLVTLLAVSFGIGVLVPFAFICKESWAYLTNGRWMSTYFAIYVLTTFTGAIIDVKLLWNLVDIFSAVLLMVNLFGVAYLLPYIRRQLTKDIESGRAKSF
jgi:alanine or glycine:cation symporter, AGCS family